MSLRSFSVQIELNAPVEKVFQYYTDTDQLASLLPKSLHFRIQRRSTRHLSQGAFLEVEICLFKIPVCWKLRVQSFSPGRHIACLWRRAFFFLEQNDYFESLENNQTRVTTCVLYNVSFGLAGGWLDRVGFRPKLQGIFDHRRMKLLAEFQAALRVPSEQSKSIASRAPLEAASYPEGAAKARSAKGGAATKGRQFPSKITRR